MEAVKISSKYQIVIPKSVRESLQLEVGETLQVMSYENRIEYVRIQPIKQLKGFLNGINTAVEREKDRL